MRIIVTGSRKWYDYEQIYRVLESFQPVYPLDSPVTVVHGGNGRWNRVEQRHEGADRLADMAARKLRYDVEVFHAAWSTYGKRAGPIRNQRMVDAGADLMVAFPLEDSVGTYDAMKRAERVGIIVVRGDQMVFPGA